MNSEVTFAGSDTPANMIKAIDTTMNSLKGAYGIVTASTCVGKGPFIKIIKEGSRGVTVSAVASDPCILMNLGSNPASDYNFIQKL